MAGIGIEGEKATPGVSSVIIIIKTFLDQSDSLVLFQKFTLLFVMELCSSLPPDVLSQLGSSQFPGVDSL